MKGQIKELKLFIPLTEVLIPSKICFNVEFFSREKAKLEISYNKIFSNDESKEVMGVYES